MSGLAPTPSPPPSRWRPSPARASALVVGLCLFGVGEALLVASGLGNSPWTVFAQGAARQSGLTVGLTTNLIGALVLVCWIPLRQRPGLGTLANILLVGTTMDVALRLLGDADGAWRVVAMVGGIGLVALGSGLYLGSALGPGPRDGLMTGLHRVTGRSLRTMRATVEITVLVLGVLLGGVAGLGTVLFALLIGPAVQLAVRSLSRVPSMQL